VNDITNRFLGRRMVAIGFCIDFIAIGFFFYSYGVFFKAIADDFEGSRLGVSLGIVIAQGTGALLAPLIGRALDRYPIKQVIALAATSLGIGFILLGFTTSPLWFYLVMCLFMGFGSTATAQIGSLKLISNWFVLKRGTALGIASTGISIGGMVMPAVSAWFIVHFGWREGFMVYGLITLVVLVPLVLRFVVSRPEDVGLLPDGLKSQEQLPPARSPLKTSEMVVDRNFIAMVVIIGLLFGIQSATLIHMVPRATDIGIDLVAAAFIASVCAGTGVVGKLAFGSMIDRMPVRLAFWIAVASQVIGQSIMFLNNDYALFMFGAAIFGFGMGGIVPMQGAVVGAAFGRASFGQVMGVMHLLMAFIHLAGPPFTGWVYDHTGSYDAAFLTFFGLYGIVALAIAVLRVETRGSRRVSMSAKVESL
tara:strand:+ start:1877 stop:3139 length:1263 start_codon:yes stop_codon:yes gene_type:complete